MRIVKMEVTYAERRSENFQTAESSVTLTAEIEDGDDCDKCYANLRREAYSKVKKTIGVAMREICEPGSTTRAATRA